MSETTTIFGPVVDRLGLAQARYLGDGGKGGLPVLRTRSWATPSSEFRREQPATIPLNVNHDRAHPIGRVVHLERDTAERLIAVALVDGELDPELELYYSAEVDYLPGGTDVRLTGVALTDAPAGVGLSRVRALAGEFDLYRWSVNAHERELLERARASYHRGQHNVNPTAIYDQLPAVDEDGPWAWSGLKPGDPAPAGLARSGRTGPWRHGPPGWVISVR
jgi:hypothetical protein